MDSPPEAAALSPRLTRMPSWSISSSSESTPLVEKSAHTDTCGLREPTPDEEAPDGTKSLSNSSVREPVYEERIFNLRQSSCRNMACPDSWSYISVEYVNESSNCTG